MTLEYITNSINRKIYQNPNIIIYTYHELRVKEDLSEEKIDIFLYYAKIRLENLRYQVFTTGEKYSYKGNEAIVTEDKLLIAIKEQNNL